jgi:hypothetical protein
MCSTLIVVIISYYSLVSKVSRRCADTIDEDGTTYVIVKQEYRGHVRASRIRRLGPAEMYEIAAQEVFPFLKRVAANPALLGQRMGWRQCYKSAVACQYGRLNEAMHGVGSKRGGEDIHGKKTTLSFWQEADESWKLKAPSIVGKEKFVEMVKVAAAKFEEGVRRNGLGWFEELEANSEKWQRFKKLSVLLQGVSPNEAFFGHSKWEAKRNPQERVDSIGAHASIKLNRTFTGKNFKRIKKNRLMLLCLRRTVKARREKRRKQIMQTKTLAQAHKLQNMAALRDKQMRKQRAQLAREAVERDTPLPSAAEYCAEHVNARQFKEPGKEWRERLVGKRVTAGAQKETVKVWEERAKEAEAEAMGSGEFKDYTMEIYTEIVHGRRYTKGVCTALKRAVMPARSAHSSATRRCHRVVRSFRTPECSFLSTPA